MQPVRLRFLAGGLLLIALPSTHALEQERIAGDRVVVKLRPDASAAAKVDPALARHGITSRRNAFRDTESRDPELFRRVGLDRIYVLDLPREDRRLVRKVVRDLALLPWVEYAEPVILMEDLASPDDPEFPNQWAHENTGQLIGGNLGVPDADIDSTDAWDLETGDPSTVIAVIDGGFDLDHEDLADNFIAGYDFVDDDPDPGAPEGGHGTRVSGIAAAVGDNGIGVSGVCWNCSLMPLRRGPDNVSISNAIQFAADNGADVINMSFAAWGSWPRITFDALEYARGLGAIGIAGAGNDGVYFPVTPAALDNALAAGASMNQDERADLSNIGEHIGVVAPGEDVYTTDNDFITFAETYTASGGTSMSTPFVSAVAALLRAHDPDLHVNELRHLLTLGAEDGVGIPAEDTPGYDPFMGHGRLNARGSLDRIDGDWLTLDRPHYLCAGTVTVAFKDPSAVLPVTATVTGSLGGDTETLTLGALTANGYYEGTLPISWAGVDGPVVPNDGKLDLQDGETITATRGGLDSTALVDCVKEVCPAVYRPLVTGDCDRDRTLDPGELWKIELPLSNRESLLLDGADAVLSTTHPDVTVLQGTSTYDEVPSWFRGGTFAHEDGSDDPFFVRVAPGTPANGAATFQIAIAGRGWEPDTSLCEAGGFPSELIVPLNREVGPSIREWDFDTGSSQGFTHQGPHGTGIGSLSECTGPFYFDSWTGPVTDRSHSGNFSMRVGDGIIYGNNNDGALISPQFTVPPGGGAVGFYAYMLSGMVSETLAADGMTLEVLPDGAPAWEHLPGVTYNTDTHSQGCDLQGDSKFPFGTDEVVDLLSGDAEGDLTDGDTFDVEHLADLSAYAGQKVRVGFRFGANSFHNPDTSVGVWIDTINLYSGWLADSWPGVAPTNPASDDSLCPSSLELTWDAVAGAGGYNVYRSETSCAAAQIETEIYGTSNTNFFDDMQAVEGVAYHYAVEATETGSGCPGERLCVAATCACGGPPADPTSLLMDKSATDVLMIWDDPSLAGMAWNVYREIFPDRTLWVTPHQAGVGDADGGTPGIQNTDPGAVPDLDSYFYLVTAANLCGESGF